MQPSSRAESRDAAVNVPELIQKVVTELAEVIARRNAEIEVGRTAEGLFARGPESAIHQILYHVIRNAIEASPNCGLVRVHLHQRAGQVVVEVTDDGQGVAPAYMSKIFKRGFTTKAGCKGQGLAEVEACLGRIRGAIAWESPLRSGKGCRFTVNLPAIAASPAQPADK